MRVVPLQGTVSSEITDLRPEIFFRFNDMALHQDSDTKRDFQVYSFLWERRERETEREREIEEIEREAKMKRER